jgi:hypothetical protein
MSKRNRELKKTGASTFLLSDGPLVPLAYHEAMVSCLLQLIEELADKFDLPRSFPKPDRSRFKGGRILSSDGQPSPEYAAYRDMLGKCYNPLHPEFKTHGAVGIKVCDRWLGKDGYQNFYEDVGPAPIPKR